MASGSIRITNIPVTLGGTTYTLGATATWSSSRSGNTVTVSGKVTTDSTAEYINQMISSYAVTCDIKFGSNSAKTITLKEGSNVDTILGISANYKYSYTVDAGSTQSTIKFTVNHANNSGSGTGSGTVTYPVGYTAITAPSKIRPANIKCPWRQGVYKWVWTAGKAGTNNAIKTVQLQYRLYDSSKESWGDWKNLATVSASQTNYEWTKNIDDGDALRLRIVTTPTHGDAVTTTEDPTWDGSNNLDYATYYQTENTAIGTPTLSVTSPIVANGSSTITVSSTHGTVSPSLFYSNSSIGIKYTVTRSDNTNKKQGTMMGPIKGTKSYSFTWNGFPVGKAVTITAEVDDGWTTKTVTKTVVCGKVLSAGNLSFTNINNNEEYEDFAFTVGKPLVDDQALADDVNVTYTILGRYEGTEDYKELYSVTQTYITAQPTPSLSKAIVVNGLGGVPNASDTKIEFIARYNVTGFTTVDSSLIKGKIKWDAISTSLSISQRDGSNEHSYYRKEGNTPVGPVAIRNVTVAASNLNQKHRYIINGVAYNSTEAVIDISNMSEGYVALPYQIQEIIGNYFMTLESGNINDNNTFYKINDTNNGQYTLNMNSTDTTIFGSPNQLTFNLNYILARPIKATITFNLNGKKMLEYSNDIDGSGNINYTLGITSDNSGSLPQIGGYNIIALTKTGSPSQTISENNSLIINQDAGGNVLNIKISGVELFSYSNNSPSYTRENSAYSPMNLLDYTYANFSTIDLPRITDEVSFITGREGRTNG